MKKNRQILIVEDEEIARENLDYILSKDGYDTVAVENGKKALAALAAETFDLVITDLRMPDIDGMEILKTIRKTYPETETLLVTGFATVSSAVEAMHQGAFYYVPKPYKTDDLKVLIQRALEKRYLTQEIVRLKTQLEEQTSPLIIGQSKSIQALRETISQISAVDCNVLILGETGTGKELIARSIHHASPRRNKRFMAINCASFSEELLGNELFGHESGAYTGAKGIKKGLFETADGGTFFMDEIGDMPLSMQVKLLRVLEDKCIMRLGGVEEIPIDVRILAATNKDLKAEVDSGMFRRDLYYRLNVVTLNAPALSARKEDIQLLAHFFLKRLSKAMSKPVDKIAGGVMEILGNYQFPGNVRELENIIERAVVMCNGDTIHESHLPPDLQENRVEVSRILETEWLPLAEHERKYIIRVLEAMAGNKTKAAEILGIDRVSLWRKLKRYHLDLD
ncbi:MAG: sigma-54 dependent transcriptional regulator [bacterium]